MPKNEVVENLKEAIRITVKEQEFNENVMLALINGLVFIIENMSEKESEGK
jgi:hypothetical protein